MLTNITIIGNSKGVGAHNWTWAVNQGWCKGSGTPGNPYVVENITINGQGLRSCINITDSKAYFKINNCTVYNSRSGGNFAGIYLNNAMNGTLTGNNCSCNQNNGIYLEGCSNINITDNNILKNNVNNGILLKNSGVYNNISNNDISFCKSGINLVGVSSKYNTISNNRIYNVTTNGIFLNGTQWNTIYNNSIFNSSKDGIELEGVIGGDGVHTIEKNIIYNNHESGIYVNHYGITLTRIDIINNQIKNNGYCGLFYNSCTQGLIRGNVIDHNGYSGNYKEGGICSDNIGGDTTIKQNTISNNILYGIYLMSSAENSNIFNNTFINNIYNARDDGGKIYSNKWFLRAIGNYWSDYRGKDFDDTGVGNDPYEIGGDAGSVDSKPIWWDPPIVSNIKPVQGSTFGTDSPAYQIKVDEGRGDQFWYEIIGTGKIVSFTNLNGSLSEIITGVINQTYWESLPQGKMTIRFCVNDSRGYVGSIEVEITKYIPPAPVTIVLSDEDDDGGGIEKEDPYFWLIRAVIGGAISASVGVVIKQSYSTVKKKRQLYELISKKLDEIEKLEQFFKANLGKVDWESFQPVYKDYTKRKISQKDLIKEGKKSMGKSFTELFVPKAKRKYIR